MYSLQQSKQQRKQNFQLAAFSFFKIKELEDSSRRVVPVVSSGM
jgi:hypothetical protein